MRELTVGVLPTLPAMMASDGAVCMGDNMCLVNRRKGVELVRWVVVSNYLVGSQFGQGIASSSGVVVVVTGMVLDLG